MAVHVQPFVRSGTPMSDVKEFVPYFDHVNIMTYGKENLLYSHSCIDSVK